jgi:hypothetical protein
MKWSDARNAWNSAVSINVLVLALTLVAVIAFPAPLHSALTAVRVIQVVFCAIWLVILHRDGDRPRFRVSLVAFGLAPLPELVRFSVLAVAHEAAGVTFEPLLRQRAAMLIVALLTPRQLWLAVLMIAAFAVESCSEYWIPGLGATKNFGPHEPWITLGTAAFAIWIAYSRAKLLNREQALEKRLREAREAARVARLALAVRDLANTPLQVLELQLALLEAHPQLVSQRTAPIRRALTRLKKLNRILADYQPRGDDWELLESFNAQAVLRDLQRQPARGGEADRDARLTTL